MVLLPDTYPKARCVCAKDKGTLFRFAPVKTGDVPGAEKHMLPEAVDALAFTARDRELTVHRQSFLLKTLREAAAAAK